VDPGQVAAIIVEPVQGEGGCVPAPRGFLNGLRRLCDEHGILLIADEIQTGLARTGKMFACEHDGVRADLVTIAKGLGGGLPIAAIVGRADLMDAAPAGALGGTYAGNPLSVAAAHAVLDVIEEENLCARAAHIGSRITCRLQDIASRKGFEGIGNVRGPGAMVGFELVQDRATRTPHPALCSTIVAEAQKRGALLLSCGTRNNVIRLLPALTMPDTIVEEGLDIVEAAIKASVAGLARDAA
jgi:4-aminobutyrate aminotransferase/(S)-3-amino-2-methylpropionate transaminase